MSDDIIAAVLAYSVMGSLIIMAAVHGFKELWQFFHQDLKRLDEQDLEGAATVMRRARHHAEERANQLLDQDASQDVLAYLDAPPPDTDPAHAALVDSTVDNA